MQLMPYQERGRNYILKHRYVLLGDEMGLGKTCQALSVLWEVTGPVLIVCPAMLRLTWANECEKMKLNYRINPITSAKHKILFDNDVINIISYETLKKVPHSFMPRVLVFDEAHYLKTVKAQRTVAAHTLVFRTTPDILVLLTGTPVKNKVTEFFSLLKLLSYCPFGTNGLGVTEKSQYAWNMRFTYPKTRQIAVGKGYKKKYVEVTEFSGLRNADKLKEYFEGKYLRRLATSVLDLPEIIYKDIMLRDNTNKNDRELEQAFNAFNNNSRLFDTEENHVSVVKATNAYDKAVHTARYVAAIVEQNESVVVFTDHVDSAKKISEQLDTSGIKSYCITGKVNPIVREELVFRFQNDENPSVLVATIGSASTGFTLTKAWNLVYNDLPWVPADLMQSSKRIHRIGQRKNCVIHYILGSRVDMYIKNKLHQKMEHLKEII